MLIIGDVHGHHKEYLDIIKDSENSVQLGDFGFDYRCLDGVDAEHHKIILGNHDHYTEYRKYNHFLDLYGLQKHQDLEFYYVRGGYSIDYMYRMEGVDFFSNEELRYHELYNMIKDFSEKKPKVVLTHEPPCGIVQFFTKPFFYAGRWIMPSKTGMALQEAFALHQPDVWVFGHFHKSWGQQINGTHFICLNEMETVEI